MSNVTDPQTPSSLEGGLDGQAAESIPARGPGAPHDLLTVAVEDYFQVSAFRRLIRPTDWYRFERRVERNVARTLDLLDEFDVKATFFALGWVADEMPEVLARIAARGHELGTKGYYHNRIEDLTPGAFREDLLRSREAIERATGVRVWGHRVARGHFGLDHLWALDVLAEEGFAYDTSMYPRLRSLRDQPWRRFAHVHRSGDRQIIELPLATWNAAGLLLPIAGGNYLRQIPHRLMRRFVGDWHRETEQPFVMYFHVWELDADLPRISAAPVWQRLRQYRHLDRMPALLRHYLSTYHFGSIRDRLGLAEEKVDRVAAKPAAGGDAIAVSARRLPVSIVVPCYNEESVLPYLRNTLDRVVSELGVDYDLSFVFVDDGSSDGTWEALGKHFAALDQSEFVQHATNRGVAAAILTGIRQAKSEIVCSIDCDCTYDPQQLRRLIPALADDVACVTASPYHPNGRVRNVPSWRLGLSRTLSMLYRRVYHQKLWTYTSCFRVYRKSAMEDMELRESGFLGVAEMLAVLDQRGETIVEQPATLEVRMLGHSKMRLLRTIWGHVRLLARLTRNRALGRDAVRGLS